MFIAKKALLHHFYRRGRTWGTVFDLLCARLSHRDPPPKEDGMLYYLGCWFCIFPPRGRRKRASRFVTLALADVFSLCPMSDSPVLIFCGGWMTILSRQMRCLSHAKNFVWIQTPEKQQRGFLIYACLLCCFHEQQRQLLWVMNICFFPYCLCNADNLSISKYLHFKEIWQFTEHFTHFVLKFSTSFEPLYTCTFIQTPQPPPAPPPPLPPRSVGDCHRESWRSTLYFPQESGVSPTQEHPLEY
jgi:hypothetical protein